MFNSNYDPILLLKGVISCLIFGGHDLLPQIQKSDLHQK